MKNIRLIALIPRIHDNVVMSDRIGKICFQNIDDT